MRERNNYKKKGCVLNEIIIQIKASTRYSTSYHKASMKVVTSNAHIKVLSDELLIKTKITKLFLLVLLQPSSRSKFIVGNIIAKLAR